MTEKVFLNNDNFDDEITDKEKEIIELFIEKTLKNKKLLTLKIPIITTFADLISVNNFKNRL